MEHCIASICFVPLDTTGQKIFGFAEFLAGLALMVLAWTTADVRYRFRIAIAPLPLKSMTFYVVAVVGGLTLLTDLWRAQGWLVPKGDILTPAVWQVILAGFFLFNFLAWAWFAFIRPPVYGRLNYVRFGRAIYHFILKGTPSELAIIADELTHSFKAIVHYAPVQDRFRDAEDQRKKGPSKCQAIAHDLLSLIADKRFCRAIVKESPMTALAVFHEMQETKKYGINVGAFARNIVHEALVERDSFLYHETEGYETGLIGFHRPVTQAMFSEYRMVETVSEMLDQSILWGQKCDAEKWEAYCRIVLITIRAYLENGHRGHSYVLNRAMHYVQQAPSDLYKLDGVTSSWDSDARQRLDVAVRFVKSAIALMSENPKYNERVRWRIREEHGRPHESLHDLLAGMIFELIQLASAVRSPRWECWDVQHNSLWGEFFSFGSDTDSASKIVKFKLRRLIYDEIVNMRRFPNFKGARTLSYCLNMLGLSQSSRSTYAAGSRQLALAIRSWTKRNFAWLYDYNPEVGKACLTDGITYDQENCRLVRIYPVENLRRKPHVVYLDLDKLK